MKIVIQNAEGEFLTDLLDEFKRPICWTPFAAFATPVYETHALELVYNIPGMRICVLEEIQPPNFYRAENLRAHRMFQQAAA
jgi:hypothetical protein